MNQTLSKWAPMPLRLILGVGFLYHGAPKLFSAPDHQMFLGMLQGMGVPAAGLMAWVVGIVEVLGGLALIVGAFVSVASALLIANMLVALFAVHLPNGFNFMNITGMTDAGPQFGMPGGVAGIVTPRAESHVGGPELGGEEGRLKPCLTVDSSAWRSGCRYHRALRSASSRTGSRTCGGWRRRTDPAVPSSRQSRV